MSDTQQLSVIQSDATPIWVVRLPASQVASLGAVRHIEGVRILVDGSDLWLQGGMLTSAILQKLRMIPDADLFVLRQNDRLARLDSFVPSDRLPVGEWQPLKSWLQLTLPSAGFTAAVQSKVRLTLVRTPVPQSANTLLTDWPVWKAYAVNAPVVRLSRLAFAVSSDRQVLIMGTPLPPIPGKQFIESHGIILPCGWRFEPDIGHRVAAGVLMLSTAEFALFRDGGAYERLSRSSFVQASRSAVRATDE